MATSPQIPQLARELNGSTAPPDDRRTIGQVVVNGGSSVRPESLSTFIVELIARMRGLEPTDCPFRLYDYVEPDALDALFEHAQRHDDADWRFELEVDGTTLEVDSEGFVSSSS